MSPAAARIAAGGAVKRCSDDGAEGRADGVELMAVARREAGASPSSSSSAASENASRIRQGRVLPCGDSCGSPSQPRSRLR